MSAPDAADVAARLALLRDALAQAGTDAGALRLRGADWLAWATAGAAMEPGAQAGAELLVTADEACILTDEADAPRLRAALVQGEGVAGPFTFHIAPWAEPELNDTYALGAAGGRAVLSDVPQRAGELALPAQLATLLRVRRAVLRTADQERYRALGRDAAVAVGEALRAARPDWSDHELAGACAHALWRRGIEPVLLLAACEPRGKRAQLAVSARRHGLHAHLVRSVAFGPLTDDERSVQQALLQLEATGLDAVRPGQSLAAVYHALDAGYRHANQPDAIRAGRQGGVTGYAVHELVATPSTATGIEAGMAIALQPGFAGARAGDTFLLGAQGLENLTVDPNWPVQTIAGRARPVWLEVT